MRSTYFLIIVIETDSRKLIDLGSLLFLGSCFLMYKPFWSGRAFEPYGFIQCIFHSIYFLQLEALDLHPIFSALSIIAAVVNSSNTTPR